VHAAVRAVVYEVRATGRSGRGAVPLTFLINPVVLPIGEKTAEDWEGCLSLPGLTFPLQRAANVVAAGFNMYGDPVTVEGSETLARSGLALPTEAQWECACRAGTSSAYWSGDEAESLRGVANLSDSYAKSHGSDSLTTWEAWLDDGQTLDGRVGSYRANAYGLHDTHGNLWEWCRDWYGRYGERVRAGDGERQASGAANRVYRGGSFSTAAIHARSAFRFIAPPDYANDNLGVRPARSGAP